MKDAGIEAKRDHDDPGGLTATLGPVAREVEATLAEAGRAGVIKRIWEKDASLWKDDAAHQKIISNSLGWLTVTERMLQATGEIEEFAARIRSEGFRHAMVCGMGGSSLCPEVLRQTLGPQPDFPELLVLDSTDPDAVNNFAQQIDLERCLFVIASKSGTTTEPVAFHRYWHQEVSRVSDLPGNSFIAITDPGTLMEQTATEEKFKQIFLNPSDIGGRYSALSYFGMVPGALMGWDVKSLLERGQAMADRCKSDSAADNPAALLGAIMAASALSGRDKLTVVSDKKLSTFGLWVEQLVAESTGKEGKGIVPVLGETLASPALYADDRLFVSIAVGEIDDEARSKLKALEDAGHPVVYRTLSSLYDLGAEFFLWELATAFAGWRLAINPFDQPNVQESKDMTKALLDRFTREGKLDDQIAADDDAFVEHVSKVQHGDYIALLAYVEETPEIEAGLQELRNALRNKTRCATTVGYGPRFLHSTGQLHKGGPNTGVFFQFTAPDKIDMNVPGTPYTFSILKQAQAQGDLQALLAHGRRAIRIDLGTDTAAGLRRLRDLVQK